MFSDKNEIWVPLISDRPCTGELGNPGFACGAPRKNARFSPGFDLGIISGLCSVWVRHRPSVRGRARGAAGEARRSRGGREGVGPRRRGSAAAWATLRGHNTCPSSRMATLSGSIDSLGESYKYQKFSRKSLFTASRVFMWVRHILFVCPKHNSDFVDRIRSS